MREHQLAQERDGNDFEIRGILISLLRNTVPRVALKIAASSRSGGGGRVPCGAACRIFVCGADGLFFFV